MKQGTLGKISAFITPYLDKNGYELLKMEFVEEDHNWYLRLYIDLADDEREKRSAEPAKGSKAGLSAAEEEVQDILDEIDPERHTDDEAPLPGININDCAKVSRYLSRWLDREDLISETYTLEVCSRGFLEDSGQEIQGET